MRRFVFAVLPLWLLFCSVLYAEWIVLDTWRIVGPIPLEQYNQQEDDRFIQKELEEVHGRKTIPFINNRNESGVFFLDAWSDLPTDNSMAYASMHVVCAEERYYEFFLATDFATEIFINGESVFKVDDVAWQNVFLAKLRQGDNRIVIKSWHTSGTWNAVLRIQSEPMTESEYQQRLERNKEDRKLQEFSQNQLLIGENRIGVVGKEPTLHWSNPENAQLIFGDGPLQIKWFDETMSPVADFNDAKLYWALIEGKTLDGKEYKTLSPYYLLPENYRQMPEMQEFVKEFADWEDPFRCLEWYQMILHLNRYWKCGDKASFHKQPVEYPAAVLAWRRQYLPREEPQIPAPPKELDRPLPKWRPGTETEGKFRTGAVKEFELFCQDWFEQSKEPFYIYIVRNGVIVFAKGYGELDGKAVDGNTVCSLASISKYLTGMLFARFLDQNLMDLDENMIRFMPILGESREWVLTPRHCFSHASGFSGHYNLGGIYNVLGDYSIATWLPAARPGTTSLYNGVGYNVMGLYMMFGSGLPIDELFRLNYFNALEIQSVNGDDQGGGYSASADDLLKFAQIMLNKGRYDRWEFFSEETWEKLLPVKLSETFAGINENTGWFSHYGVGMHLFVNPKNPEVKYIGHGAASGSIFSFDPESQTAIVVTRNNPGERYESFRDNLLLLVHEQAEEAK